MTDRGASLTYQLASCQGKAAFETFAVAEKVAKRRRRQKIFKNGRPQTPYKCEACGRWHIGARGRPIRGR